MNKIKILSEEEFERMRFSGCPRIHWNGGAWIDEPQLIIKSMIPVATRDNIDYYVEIYG